MDVDNIWRKGRNYKGKGKGKGNYKGSKSKGKCRSKGHYKGFDKGNKGNYNKGGYNKSKGKGYSGSKGYGSSKGYKGEETAAHNMSSMWQAWPLGTRLRSASMAHRRRRKLHPPEQEQADHDDNEELLQGVNDTWTGTTKEKKDNTR